MTDEMPKEIWAWQDHFEQNYQDTDWHPTNEYGGQRYVHESRERELLGVIKTLEEDYLISAGRLREAGIRNGEKHETGILRQMSERMFDNLKKYADIIRQAEEMKDEGKK